MVAAIWTGVLLGLGAAMPIGPVNVEIARRTLGGGFARGAALGLGAVTVDVGYAVLTSLAARSTAADWANGPVLKRSLAAAGAALLAYLAYGCFRNAVRAMTTRDQAPEPAEALPETGTGRPAVPGLGRSYLAGLGMTALNPMTLGFWFVAVPGALAGPGTDAGDVSARLPYVAAGVALGAATWVAAFTGTLAAFARFKRGWWMAAADALGGAVLLGFAAKAAWGAIAG